MDDRELLEMAAKVAGVVLVWSSEPSVSPRIHGSFDAWNPLTDDGDALRLAVKLRIKHDRHPAYPFVAAWAPETQERFEEPEGDDPYAATRRAIVRAAAEIGRGG